MKCGTCAINEFDKKFQDLSSWNNYTLEDLRKRIEGKISDDDEVRVYTVATTWFDKNFQMIRHRGTGPNLEGGLATLCTCKRSMRQGRPLDYWKGKWILGLTSRAKSNHFCGSHYFLYLMKVKYAFESHKALYDYLEKNNPSALRIKKATKNILGDVYVPMSTCLDSLDPRQYEYPCKGHDHGCVFGEEYKPDENCEWEKDISNNGRSTPQLLGDTNDTFVWQKRMIKFNEDRGPGNKIIRMKQLLSSDYIDER